MESPDQSSAAPSPDEVAKWLLSRQTQIVAYTRVIVHDMQVAEDIFQEVCVSAIKVSNSLDSAEGCIKWAMKVARNKAIDYLRRTRRDVALLSPELLDHLCDEWIALEHNDQRKAYQQSVYKNLEYCMAKLTTRTRALLDMRYGEGKKPNEIAAILNQKVQAVYKTLTRSHASLRACMHKRAQTTQES